MVIGPESKIYTQLGLLSLEILLQIIPDVDSTSEWFIETWFVVEVWVELAKFSYWSKLTSWSYWAWEMGNLLLVDESIDVFIKGLKRFSAIHLNHIHNKFMLVEIWMFMFFYSKNQLYDH